MTIRSTVEYVRTGPFRFLDLPRAVRDRVYELVLQSQTWNMIRAKTNMACPRHAARWYPYPSSLSIDKARIDSTDGDTCGRNTPMQSLSPSLGGDSTPTSSIYDGWSVVSTTCDFDKLSLNSSTFYDSDSDEDPGARTSISCQCRESTFVSTGAARDRGLFLASKQIGGEGLQRFWGMTCAAFRTDERLVEWISLMYALVPDLVHANISDAGLEPSPNRELRRLWRGTMPIGVPATIGIEITSFQAYNSFVKIVDPVLFRHIETIYIWTEMKLYFVLPQIVAAVSFPLDEKKNTKTADHKNIDPGNDGPRSHRMPLVDSIKTSVQIPGGNAISALRYDFGLIDGRRRQLVFFYIGPSERAYYSSRSWLTMNDNKEQVMDIGWPGTADKTELGSWCPPELQYMVSEEDIIADAIAWQCEAIADAIAWQCEDESPRY